VLVFTGFGLILCLFLYVGIMFVVSRFIPENTTKFNTVLFLVIGNIIATIINYLIAKQLNKDGLKHTIGAGVSLEKAVLGLGIGVCILAVIIYFAK